MQAPELNATIQRLFPGVELRYSPREGWVVYKRGKVTGREYVVTRFGQRKPATQELVGRLNRDFVASSSRYAVRRLETMADAPQVAHDARDRARIKDVAKTEGFDRARYAIQRAEGFRRLSVTKPEAS